MRAFVQRPNRKYCFEYWFILGVIDLRKMNSKKDVKWIGTKVIWEQELHANSPQDCQKLCSQSHTNSSYYEKCCFFNWDYYSGISLFQLHELYVLFQLHQSFSLFWLHVLMFLNEGL